MQHKKPIGFFVVSELISKLMEEVDFVIRPQSISWTNLVLVFIYIFSNAVFIWKYAPEYVSEPSVVLLCYVILAPALVWLMLRGPCAERSTRFWNINYLAAVGIAAILLTVLMLRFDPETIEVGRYAALHDWITRLLTGEFPYAAETAPSGFPFLFVLAMPFYFLGDSGLFQVFSFLLFALLILFRQRWVYRADFGIILLLVTSPIFLYEVVVRSELFSNMVVVLSYLMICESRGSRWSFHKTVLLGIVGGLLLSTRGVVLLVYIICLGHMLISHKIKRPVLFLASILAGFSITITPFLIWDIDFFTRSGPFIIQTSYTPTWVLALAVVSSVICGLSLRTAKSAYTAAAVTLFGTVFISFIVSVLHHGLSVAVFADRFDISYFCFALPFVLISLEPRSPNKQLQPRHN